MSYVPSYGVLEGSSVPTILVDTCFETDDILTIEIGETDGTDSLRVQVESCISQIPSAEWLFIDLPENFIEKIMAYGVEIKDLSTGATFIVEQFPLDSQSTAMRVQQNTAIA